MYTHTVLEFHFKIQKISTTKLGIWANFSNSIGYYIAIWCCIFYYAVNNC